MFERVIRLEEKTMSLDSRVSLADQDSRALSQKMDTHFYWMLAALGGVLVSISGLLIKGFNWL